MPGLLARAIERRASAIPGVPVAGIEDAWLRGTIWQGLANTATGRSVTPSSALQSVTVLACVRVIAETIATLPLVVYARESAGKRRAPEHPLYRTLHDAPNPEMTAVEFRECMIGHLALRGNAYAYIERLDNGEVYLWPLRPDRMTVFRDSEFGGLRYLYTLPSGEQRRFTSRDVLHIRGLSPDGIQGYSPVTLAREAIGLALATEEFGARLFANSAAPSGVLERDGLPLTPDARARLVDGWNAAHQGLSSSHKVAVLEDGMKWRQIGMTSEDAQFLETRGYQDKQIAALFRVPPHKVGIMAAATFSNIEHQAIEFVVDTIRPWCERIENRLNVDLFGGSSYYCEFVVEGLLRGDAASMAAFYAAGLNNAWFSPNEVRDFLNLNPVAGGDQLFRPLALAALDAPPAIQEVPA